MVKQCRGIVIAAALLGAMAGSALAADAYSPQEEAYADSGFYLRGDAGWSWLNSNALNDGSIIVGGGIGYQWGSMFRTDVRVDESVTDSGWNRGSPGLLTATFNGYVDFPMDSVIKPYIGAGIGYGVAGSKFDQEHGAVTALMAGVTFDFNRYVALDVGYRFLNMATDGGIFDTKAVNDHSVTAGVRFTF
jgi:opacity protein-like surface antigen